MGDESFKYAALSVTVGDCLWQLELAVKFKSPDPAARIPAVSIRGQACQVNQVHFFSAVPRCTLAAVFSQNMLKL